MNNHNQHTWGVILAAGDGTRLQPFVRSRYHLTCPKQFCAFTGSRSLLRHTIDRVETVIPRQQLLTIVGRRHMKYAEPQLADRPPDTVLMQPRNRETAPGILHSLLRINRRDPEAVVCLFPSDQFILEERRFMACVRRATRIASVYPGSLILLGVQPTFVEDGYGWIEKGERLSGESAGQVYRVHRFIEKPDMRMAQVLYLTGSLLNTMVVVCRAQTLLNLFERNTPSLFAEFSKIKYSLDTPMEAELLDSLYARIPAVNFSYAILERNPEELRVLEVRNVYWSDWGVPERVEFDLKTFFAPAARTARTPIAEAEDPREARRISVHAGASFGDAASRTRWQNPL